jgi:hypothetical protein
MDFRDIAALIVGLSAVACFLLSYLQSKRRRIVALNLTSRILYVAQYLILGAWEGAALDVIGAVSAALAQNRDKGWLRKWATHVFVAVNVALIAVGLLLYRNIFSLLPLLGVLLQTDALWLKKEKHIRILSIIGCPFWFAYNFQSGAYGSCAGDFLACVSLCISLVRYDILGRKPDPANHSATESGL